MFDRQDLGRKAEEYAACYLLNKGYQILQRNFECRLGEIDIVAQEGEQIVFIEVRCRRSAKFGHPLETITLQKQRRLRNIAQFYLMVKNKDVPARFDVVSVLLPAQGQHKVLEHIVDAF